MATLPTDPIDLTEAFGEFMGAFAAFREANDERLERLERRMSADVVTEDKVNRISDALDAQKQALDELVLKRQRPARGGDRRLRHVGLVGARHAEAGQHRPLQREAALLRQARRKVAALEVQVRNEARQAFRELQAARSQAEHYRRVLLPLHAAVVRETQLQFNAMQTGIFQLLRAKEEELEADGAYRQSLQDYWVAQARLARAVGGRLPEPVPPDPRSSQHIANCTQHFTELRGSHPVFRIYLRTVIVTAAVYWRLGSRLRPEGLTSPRNVPAPGRRQCVYIVLRLRTHLCF